MSTTSNKDSIKPRKSASQARSTQTVQHILEAAARILAREAQSAFNTNRIAELAGVSIGSLYQYFPSKEAILAQLVQQAQSALADRVEQCLQHHDNSALAEGIRALIQVAIQHQHAEPGLASAIDRAERQLEVSAILQNAQLRMCGAFAQWLHPHFPDARSKQLELAAIDCFRIVKALVDMPTNERGLSVRAESAVIGYLQAVLK
jgi:AcrR family transcriptional regulator